MTWQVVSGFWYRPLYQVHTTCPLALRREIRRRIGWRRSLTYRYVQIGSNSLQVQSQCGHVVLHIYKVK